MCHSRCSKSYLASSSRRRPFPTPLNCLLSLCHPVRTVSSSKNQSALLGHYDKESISLNSGYAWISKSAQALCVLSASTLVLTSIRANWDLLAIVTVHSHQPFSPHTCSPRPRRNEWHSHLSALISSGSVLATVTAFSNHLSASVAFRC